MQVYLHCFIVWKKIVFTNYCEYFIVVIGRSKIVGTPVSEILKWHHATVTVCHSKTKNLEDVVKQADILVVAIGKKKYIREYYSYTTV